MGTQSVQNNQQNSSNNSDFGVISTFKSQFNSLVLISASGILLIVVIFFIFPSYNSRNGLVNLTKLDIAKPEIVGKNLSKIGAIGDIEREIIIKSFYERDLEKAATASGDFKRSEPYRNLYSTLWARHNVTKDSKILEQMYDIETLIKTEWPLFYEEILKGGGFLR